MTTIGLVAPPWVPVPPAGYGGTEAIIDRLARGYLAAGHEVVLFTTGDSTCPVPKRWVFVKSDPDSMGSGVKEMRQLLSAYGSFTTDLDVDVVHDHTLLGPVTSVMFPGPPVVSTNHVPFNPDVIDLYRYASHRVHVVCVSGSQRSAAPDLVDRVVHNGVDMDEYPFGEGGGGYVLFLGRMNPDKGAHRAIIAARKAGVPIRMAAKMRERTEKDYFEAAVRPLLGADAEYLGEVSNEDKLTLLRGATALLNPIRWPEPFGLVMTEALSTGTPVIAFPAGAAPEIVDDGVTGFLVESEDEMAAAIARVGGIDRASCRRAVEQRFSTETMVTGYLAFFDELLAGQPGRSGEPGAAPSADRAVADT